MHILDWAKSRPNEPEDSETDFTRALVCTIKGHVDRLTGLIDGGLDIERQFGSYWPKRMQALISGHEEHQPWDDSYGGWTTLMHIAARYNQLDILRLLVQRGAVIDCVAWHKADQCSTPLSEAANFGHLDAVRFLLKAGARADYTIPLREGEATTVSSDLLRRSLDPRMRGGLIPSESIACWKDRRRIFDLLLKHGADTSFQQPNAHIPTMEMAIRFNQLEVVRELLERGVPCEGTLKGFVCNPVPGQNLLNLIVANGATDVEEALDPIHIDNVRGDGRSGSTKISHWPSTVIQNRYRAMGLILKRFSHFTETSQAPMVMVRAAQFQDIALMEVLVANGVSIDCVGSCGYAPIHMASFRPDMEALEWLLTNGADVTKQAVTSELLGDCHLGDTALHCAAQEQQRDKIERLLAAGANVHATNGHGETPLLSLCRHVRSVGYWDKRGPIEQLKLLLHAGADVTATDLDGKTALHLLVVEARHSNEPYSPQSCGPIIEFMIKHGVDPLRRDGNGKLALQYASEYEQSEFDPLRIALERCTPDFPLVMELLA